MPKHDGKQQEQTMDLPKNIQQIGSSDSGIKVYLEDYSGTYIRRILSDETPCHGILLGQRKTDQKQNYVFIQAVIGIRPEDKETYWKYDWNRIYELMQRYFIEEGKEKPEILGYAMAIDGVKKLDITELERMHKSNFEGNRTLTLTLDMQEGKEQFYVLENNKFHAIDGYYIYYEKNKSMQTYVLENQPGPCVETEEIVKGNSESYRTILQKRKERMQRKQTVSLLYVASSFLVMMVIVLGITMMNNYEKIKKMQGTINDLSKSVVNEDSRKEDQEQISTMASVQPVEPQSSEEAEVVQAMSQNVNSLESQQPATTEAVQSQSPQTPRKRYEIQPGDTLAAISIKVYNTDQMVDKICEYNHIENSDQIVAGDVLILP